MGHKHTKQQASEPDMQDAIFDMKMAGRQMANAGKRAQKDQQKEINKARAALKKNDEEGAKMYLQNAANKYKEGQNMQKMAMRMDAMGTNIQANNNNVELMNNLNKVTPLLMQQGQQMNPQQMSDDLRQYQTAMDNIEVAGRIMNSDMNQMNYDQASSTAVDDMLNQLKQEVAAEITTNLSKNPDLIFNSVKNDQLKQVGVEGKI